MNSLYLLLSNIILILSFISCSSYSCKNEPLIEALNYAKTNKAELEKVLKHYASEPEKLAAAKYLIENMPLHYTLKQYYVSSQNEIYKPDIFFLSDSEKAVNKHDSLIQNGYKLKNDIVCDIETINSQFLIENIELAFKTRDKVWAKDVSFENFCEYILPYRAQTEELSQLRKTMMDFFIPMLDSAHVKTPLEACVLINNYLKKKIKYIPINVPLYSTIDGTFYTGVSDCEGLCNLAIYIMRACGIPVTIDHTIWTKMDLGHSWCVVFDNNRFYSFGPGEDNPDVHMKGYSEIRYLIPAKVYRSHFGKKHTNRNLNDDGYEVEYIKSELIEDVTKEYPNNVLTVKIPVSKEITHKESKPIYLCTYDKDNWVPIAIGETEDSMCKFENVVGDNVFIIADSPIGLGLRFITAPFYVDNTGTIQKFIPNMNKMQTHTFEKQKEYEDIIHTLYYWNTELSEFVPLTPIEQTATMQTYTQIPTNALLRFAASDERILNQRVFYLLNDSILYY